MNNRIKRAKEEIKQADLYDYQIVNYSVDEAVYELVHIIKDCRKRQK